MDKRSCKSGDPDNTTPNRPLEAPPVLASNLFDRGHASGRPLRVRFRDPTRAREPDQESDSGVRGAEEPENAHGFEGAFPQAV